MRVLIIFMVSLLTACGSPAPVPQDHFYRLPAAEVDADNRLTNGVLLVEPFRANGLIRERSLVYVDSGDSVELERYHYHLWHESPGYMLQQHLADYLRHSNGADTVTTTHAVPAEVVITGELHQFMRIHAEDGDRVVVSLELRLQHVDGDGPGFHRLYTEYEPVNGQGMTAVVKAFNRALSRIYNDFSGHGRS